MGLIKNLGILAVSLLMSSYAFANGIWVNGRTSRVDQHGAGVSTTTAYLEVTYQNQSLPWGSEVFLVSGVRCPMSGGSWQKRTFPNPMEAVAGSTWQRKLSATVADKYQGSCGDYEFVFLIKLPNGRSYYDNGDKAPLGFYSSQIPYISYDSTLKPMSVRSLASPFDY